MMNRADIYRTRDVRSRRHQSWI